MVQAFISWSGAESRDKANALRRLLADVLPGANVFMSDEDIAAGALWHAAISGSLDESVAGVIIVTPENIKNPWLHYEAGALATRVENRMVIPLLSGLTPSDLASTPLSSFQALELNRAAILRVCQSFCRALKIDRTDEAIARAFDKWWDEYKDELLSRPVSLAKAAVTLDDVHKLITSLQGQLRSQTDVLASLVRPAIEPWSPSTATIPTSSYPTHGIRPIGLADAIKAASPSLASIPSAASSIMATGIVAPTLGTELLKGLGQANIPTAGALKTSADKAKDSLS